MWLSIMPPWVGSGCRQTSVAAGSRSSGRASSPTRFSPSSVVKVIGVRRAGSTVAALISCAMDPSLEGCLAAAALHAPLPAHGMPVPPIRDARVRRPDHDVRDAGMELLVAAGAAVRLARRRARYLAHHPVAIRPVLDPLRAERRCWRGGLRPPALTRGHRHQGYPRPGPAKSHYSAFRAPCYRAVQRRLRRQAHRPPPGRPPAADREGRRVGPRAFRRRLLQPAELDVTAPPAARPAGQVDG